MRIATRACALFLLASGCTPERECGEGCLDNGPWSGSGTLDGAAIEKRIAVSHAGFLAAEVDEASGAHVRILRGSAPMDGDGRRAGALVEPGDYRVVVEGAGPYQLRIGFVDREDLVGYGIAEQVADDALEVIGTGWRKDTTRFEYVIADFSLHSSQKREWIIDLVSEKLMWNVHVAHGRGSNEPFMNTGFAPAFSNVQDSHLSSYGVMKSAEAYAGDYGQSYRIDGLEPAINDAVRPRDIVMHPWEGSREEFVLAHGETQPTWGCPAIDDRIAPMVQQATSGGVLMFFWHPDWRGRTRYL